MTDLNLNELERLEKAATPGPWEGPWGDTHTVAAFEGELNEHSLTNDPRGDAFPVTQETQPNDAALIAALRNALPEILRRLRVAEARIDALEGLLDGTEVHIQRTETGGVRLYIDYDMTEIGVGPNLRVAIDAARKP